VYAAPQARARYPTMAKKILFIENDSSFATGIAESLEASGFEVRATGEGKEGLDLAREWSPAAVVLCVELPGMSGYLVCQKLKKDDQLKSLPLVLTSAEATEETFEKHRTLKARADEYLLKPYAPQALIEKLGALIGLPEPEAPLEEEIVNLEEEVGLEGALDGSPDRELPGLDLESLPDEPPAERGGLDDDLKLLDEAFDGIAAPAPSAAAAALDELTGEHHVAAADVDAAAASLPDADGGDARDDELAALDAEAALGALGAEDETLSPGVHLEQEPPTVPVRGASAEILRAAGVKLLSEEEPSPAPAAIAPPPLPPEARERAGELERELADARAELEQARAETGDRDAEIRELEGKVRELERRAGEAEGEAEHARGRAEGLAAQLRKAEEEAEAGREEAQRAAEQAAAEKAKGAELERRVPELEARLADLERRLSEEARRAEAAETDLRRKTDEAAAAAEAAAKAEALEREADELRTELLVARGEAEGARNEVEKRTAELAKRLGDLEASSQKNEERVVKAYQKIKSDEKVREKVRKALTIALQLVDEGLPAESPAEKERRAAAAGGRE
jgi:CheY-like chemotaxis protein